MSRLGRGPVETDLFHGAWGDSKMLQLFVLGH